MDLRAIREAISERIATVPGVRPVAFAPDTVSTGNAVLVVVGHGDPYVNYHEAFNKGLAMVNMTLSPYVPMNDPRSAFAVLDELVSSGTGSPRSLIDALMDSDRTLGGVCSDLVVDDASNVQTIEPAAGVRFLSCDLAIRIPVGRS